MFRDSPHFDEKYGQTKHHTSVTAATAVQPDSGGGGLLWLEDRR
jgi:hypothetical protein